MVRKPAFRAYCQMNGFVLIVDQVVSGTSKPDDGVGILAAIAARRCQAEIGDPVP